MITPPLYDCNVWTGESDEHPTGGIDSPAALIEEMDRVGIDRALVYHVTARTEDANAGNERLMADIADYPRLTPCWVATPSAVAEYGSPEAFVDAMRAADVNAVRIFPGEHDYRLTDPAIAALLAELERAGALLVLDGLSGILQDGFTREELGDVCARHQQSDVDRPELSVLLTQLRTTMGDFSKMEALVEQVERVRNLYIDTARFQIHDGFRLFADRCGADRLLFGSHVPHASGGAAVAGLMLSGLTDDERRRVGGENLSRLLGETPADWDAAGRGPVRQFETVPYGIIDVHGHLRPDGPAGEIYPDADGVVSQMDRNGIALTCVSCLRDGKDGNDAVAHAARRYPDRLVPIAVADPNWDDVTGELERCFDDLGMRMIKIHPVSHDTPVGDEAYEPVWEFAERREALVVTHARCGDEEAAAFERVAKAHPDMTLMLYHAGRSWDQAENFVAVAEECPNVLLEITFSYNVDGVIEYLVDEVGPERVFFGTDIGPRAPESQVGWATYARIDDGDRRKLMRENGLRLLREHGTLPAAYEDEQ